jgi:polyhydroxyalkanoate synthase
MKQSAAPRVPAGALPGAANADRVAPPDAAELAQTFAQISQASSKLLGEYMQRHAAGGQWMPTDELGVAKAFMDFTARLWADPMKLAELQMKMWGDYATLWQQSWLKMLGGESHAVIEPAKTDKRFKDEDWQSNFVFDFVKQSYLIAAKHLHKTVADVEGLDAQTAKKVDFYTRQYVDAMAPTNFVLTNPVVLRETVASHGQNLVKGLSNLLADLDAGGGKQLRVQMTDADAFKVGENLAVTPGKVVFQNELMQLIQYAPLTEQQFRRPLLIVPPWINKYYILDMREKNSFVRWATQQGHTVFIISWINPDAAHARMGFEDYIRQGTLAALDAIGQATGERETDAVGFCLGGTLLATTLAVMAAKGDDRVKSATFFASLVDFADPGELGVFIDEQQVASLEKKMNERGYLEGSEMASTFNMLRANDLIWSFVVNNYLLGKDPFPFDLLYWNSDSTRMPAAMHSFYLRKMYIENRLREPGGVTLCGVPVDLSGVKVPMYFISTAEDHIAPWKSTYTGARIFGGPVRFVLGGSGHIAGIINPPAANKYGYCTRDDALPATPEAWLEGTQQHAGSWWTDWAQWVAPYAGDKVPARVPGKGGLPALEDAPGSYVKVKMPVSA